MLYYIYIPNELSIMSVLTKVFPAPQFDYSFQDQFEIGTDDYGQANFRSLLNYFLHGFQHGLALVQEIAMEDDSDGLMIPGAFYTMTLQGLVEDDAEMAALVIENDMEEAITDTVLGQLNKTNLILWTQDNTQIVLNIETVTDMLDAV